MNTLTKNTHLAIYIPLQIRTKKVLVLELNGIFVPLFVVLSPQLMLYDILERAETLST